MVNSMIIREATTEDWQEIWPFFKDIIRRGDTYGFDPSLNQEQGQAIWMTLPEKTFVAVEGEDILGSYYLKSNYAGPGKHVCNCGYMVSPLARGKGVATAMCEHSQQIAKSLDYKAMQFNFVASSNEGAVHLWKKLGFEVVGRIPKAFNHPAQGFVDSLVMYKWLAE